MAEAMGCTTVGCPTQRAIAPDALALLRPRSCRAKSAVARVTELQVMVLGEAHH